MWTCGPRREDSGRTKKIPMALFRAASVLRLPSVINFSANRCASFALCHVVCIDSCFMSDVTRFRRRACLCDELRERERYFMCPPAMMGG